MCGVQKKLPGVIAGERKKQTALGRKFRVMFQDEGRFGRINEPRRCWAPPGIRPSVPRQLVRESVYVYAAVAPAEGQLVSLILPDTNSELMSMFLEEVTQRYPDEFLLMFMDQAGWHRSGSLVVPERMRVRWLPPYSPECNPTEHIWDEIREKSFGNTAFASLDDVEEVLANALHNLECDTALVQSLTGFEWVLVSI
jgi:transposase